jgi:Reverse transcriptase (RNA-dependent DNA polymerase)
LTTISSKMASISVLSSHEKTHKDELLIIALYVDDMIFMGNSKRLIDEFKREMKLEFEMIDLGMMRYFLGLEIK